MKDNLTEVVKTLNRLLKKLPDDDDAREELIEQVLTGTANEYFTKGYNANKCNCGHVRYIDNAYPIKEFSQGTPGSDGRPFGTHQLETSEG